MKAINLFIPHRPVSWNKFWAGSRWQNQTNRKALKAEVSLLINAEVSRLGIDHVSVPVVIDFVIGMSGRMMDVDNICLKPYIDSLVDAGVLTDDTPKYVKGISVMVHKEKKEHAGVHISIREFGA